MNDRDMMLLLGDVIMALPTMLEEDRWDSLVVNRRKPHTYRAFTTIAGNARVCLHRFEPCSEEEAFPHPHPWQGAFWVAEGTYRMKVGYAADEQSDFKHAMTLDLKAGSKYAMSNHLVSHSVQPLKTCWSVMVNLPPWDVRHKDAPTTKGKDLDKMTSDELHLHLSKFKTFV